MNRFKFRVWDNQQKRMFIPIGNLYPENPDDFNFPTLWQEFNTDFANVHGAYGSFPMKYWFSKDCIIQQFTGLLDKNGKEIYEGDIVKSGTNLFQVVYSKCGESASPLSGFVLLKINNQKVCLPCILKSQLEVIGNSRENPQFLEKNEKS